MTTTELTNEEIVTRLLTANQIIKKPDSNLCASNTAENLGAFLKSEAFNKQSVNRGRYTFININSGWIW